MTCERTMKAKLDRRRKIIKVKPEEWSGSDFQGGKRKAANRLLTARISNTNRDSATCDRFLLIKPPMSEYSGQKLPALGQSSEEGSMRESKRNPTVTEKRKESLVGSTVSKSKDKASTRETKRSKKSKAGGEIDKPTHGNDSFCLQFTYENALKELVEQPDLMTTRRTNMVNVRLILHNVDSDALVDFRRRGTKREQDTPRMGSSNRHRSTPVSWQAELHETSRTGSRESFSQVTDVDLVLLHDSGSPYTTRDELDARDAAKKWLADQTTTTTTSPVPQGHILVPVKGIPHKANLPTVVTRPPWVPPGNCCGSRRTVSFPFFKGNPTGKENIDNFSDNILVYELENVGNLKQNGSKQVRFSLPPLMDRLETKASSEDAREPCQRQGTSYLPPIGSDGWVAQ